MGVPIYWLSTLFREGMRRAEAGTLAVWRINGMSPDLRMRRYLARVLAWPDPDRRGHLANLDGREFFPGV